jgi:hypothetical protein
LRQITDHQIATPADFAAVRRKVAGENLQEGGLAASIPADEADAFSLLDAERRLIENSTIAVANDEIRDRKYL